MISSLTEPKLLVTRASSTRQSPKSPSQLIIITPDKCIDIMIGSIGVDNLKAPETSEKVLANGSADYGRRFEPPGAKREAGAGLGKDAGTELGVIGIEDETTARLQEMGYKQEMKRSLGMVSVLGLSFAIMAVPFGTSTTLNIALTDGGPVTIIWGVSDFLGIRHNLVGLERPC